VPYSAVGAGQSLVILTRPGLLPGPGLLEHRLTAVAGMAGPAEVLGVEEGEQLAVVLCDVDFCADDVIDVRGSARAFAYDTQPAERITGKDEGNSLLAPGRAVIELLESCGTARPITFLYVSRAAVVCLVSFTVRRSEDGKAAAISTDLIGRMRHEFRKGRASAGDLRINWLWRGPFQGANLLVGERQLQSL
jgi:hypothetical protein